MPESVKKLFGFIKEYNPTTAILVTFAGYFVAQIFGVVMLIFYSIARGWELSEITQKLDGSVAFNLVLSIFIYGFYLLIIKFFLNLNKENFKSIGVKFPKEKWQVLAYMFAGYAVYFLFTVIASVILKSFLSDEILDQKQQLGFDTNATGLALIGVFIALVIIPPIVEEIVTRGFLFTGLRKNLNFVWSGLIVGLIFGAAHLQWGSDAPLLWAAAIDTFILSWVLVYVREKSGSLYPAIGIHMLKNLMAFLALFVFHIA